ncbi:ABC transporter substrate-binding protein [Mariniluteicoccus endophyticus]
MNARRKLPACFLSLGLLLTSACASQDPDQVNKADAPKQNTGAEIATQKRDDALRAKLPEDIQKAGKLTAVNSGSFPPYEIIQTDGSHSGASADLLKALGEMWGITIESQTVDGLSSILTGLSADRYQLAFGPVGDFKDRQKSNDFVDYVQEFVVFAVPAGNPKKITDIEATCGLKIAVQAGGSAEKVIKGQSDKCVQVGKPAVEVMSFKDQPQSILSVQSGRSDAFFSSQAPLTYFVKESNGKLELAGQGKSNGFDTLYQGAVVKKGSPMAGVLQESLQKLYDDGTYDAIMKKWGIEGNKIPKPGLNLAKS